MSSNYRIVVVGIGGGGSNAVNRMIEEGINGVDFVVVNTDSQAILLSNAPTKIKIGKNAVGFLSASGDPKLGQRFPEESAEELYNVLKGADMVFITAGMGGDTGSGVSPIVARIAKKIGAVTIAIVTRPFSFEGPLRSSIAEAGINQLKEAVDTLIVIPNDRLLEMADKQASLNETFRLADDVLRQAVQGITELTTLPGLINVDFFNVRSFLSGGGATLVTMGKASGKDRACESAKQAISSAMLDITIDGATSILFNVTGGPSLSLFEVNQIAAIIKETSRPNVNMIFGALIDPNLGDEIHVTIIAKFEITKTSNTASTTESVYIVLQTEDNTLTPILLNDTISPYLESLSKLQFVIDNIQNRPSSIVRINSLEVNPVNLKVESCPTISESRNINESEAPIMKQKMPDTPYSLSQPKKKQSGREA
jgi:cell division protein FtsZ